MSDGSATQRSLGVIKDLATCNGLLQIFLGQLDASLFFQLSNSGILSSLILIEKTPRQSNQAFTQGTFTTYHQDVTAANDDSIHRDECRRERRAFPGSLVIN